MQNFELWNILLDSASSTGDATATATTAGGGLSMVIILVAFVAIFYFMLIRPQRKKDKKIKEMLNALKAGDRICTIGGIYGTIAQIKDDTVTLLVGADKDADGHGALGHPQRGRRSRGKRFRAAGLTCVPRGSLYEAFQKQPEATKSLPAVFVSTRPFSVNP